MSIKPLSSAASNSMKASSSMKIIPEQVNEGAAVSHNKTRLFKPEKLSPPRDFQLPNFGSQPRTLTEHTPDNITPLVVEIGAGKGMHACLYAKQNPNHNLIAIERTANKFTAFQGLKNSVNKEVAELNNLNAVHADAIPYCVYALAPNSVDVVYLLYPNPEPKNPNQQWLNMPFFEFLLSRLKPNAKIILASNIVEYIDNAYEQAVKTWCLVADKKEVAKDSRRTHFEIKYLARGETCWEIELTKPDKYITRFDEYYSLNIINNE